jgi:hypothetical protein
MFERSRGLHGPIMPEHDRKPAVFIRLNSIKAYQWCRGHSKAYSRLQSQHSGQHGANIASTVGNGHSRLLLLLCRGG